MKYIIVLVEFAAQILGYMIPVLLDLLTIFFIIAGLFLLCLNLRVWRRKKLNITPISYDESEDQCHT